jgi:hypothetical protein
MAERTVCSCGAQIEEVIKSSLSPGEFWQRVGTCEVCIENHWHEPAAAPTPVEPCYGEAGFCYIHMRLVRFCRKEGLEIREPFDKLCDPPAAQPVEGRRCGMARAIGDGELLRCEFDAPHLGKSHSFEPQAAVGVERVTDNAKQGERDACEVCKGTQGGVPGNENIVNGVVMCDYCHAKTQQPIPQPANTDDRTADTIPDAKCWLPRGHKGECDPETVPRCGAETRIEVLEAALRDMLTIAEADGWQSASTGRQIVYRAGRAALAAPSGVTK